MKKASSLEDALRAPHSVHELVLSEAGLRVVPPEIAQLVNLRRLRLSGNAIKALPKTLATLTKLEDLDITANPLTKIASELSALKLRRLSLSAEKKLSAGLDVLFELPSLEELHIQSTSLGDLPASITKHKTLKRLQFFVCGFKRFPGDLGAMPRLETLDLGSSRFGELPAKAKGFKRLRSLDLSSTGIKRFPRAFCELPLTELWLGENEAIELDDNLLRLEHLETFHFNNVYKPLPAVIGELVTLRHLVISNNSCNVQTLPSFLANLSRLETLDVSNNDELAEIPDEVLRLPKLTKLVCYNSPVRQPKSARSIRDRFPHIALA